MAARTCRVELRMTKDEYEVLAEGYSKRSRQQLYGRTEQNRTVVFDKGSHRPGDFLKVRITDATSATLFGTELC